MAHPKGIQHRTKQNSFFLTPEDSIKLQDYARHIGFKRGSSQLVQAIMERLLMGGFSPITFTKIGFQLQNYAEENGFKNWQYDLFEAFRPLPALPDDTLSTRQWKKQMKQFKVELLRLEKETITQ